MPNVRTIACNPTINRVVAVLRRLALVLALLCALAPNSSSAAALKVAPALGGKGIQAALDSLPAGGEVLLTLGNYVVRDPVILRKDRQTLRGDGDGTVLFLADEANCPVVVLGSPADYPRRPTQGVRLASLLINGNERTSRRKFGES